MDKEKLEEVRRIATERHKKHLENNAKIRENLEEVKKKYSERFTRGDIICSLVHLELCINSCRCCCPAEDPNDSPLYGEGSLSIYNRSQNSNARISTD